ncbi:MAG: DUF3343 domain-containing protein [Bacillota bacterium]
MQEHYLAVFDSTHHALKFEKVLKDNEVKLQIIPVPREITANCGLAVVFSEGDKEKVKQLENANKLVIKSYYHIINRNNKKEYHKSD